MICKYIRVQHRNQPRNKQCLTDDHALTYIFRILKANLYCNKQFSSLLVGYLIGIDIIKRVDRILPMIEGSSFEKEGKHTIKTT